MIVWLYNLKEHFRLTSNYKIRCQQCRLVQDKAVDWTHQRCTGCGTYLYDERGGF